MMYSIPTPDEYKKDFERAQTQIMNKFLDLTIQSLRCGINKCFIFPDELHPDGK